MAIDAIAIFYSQKILIFPLYKQQNPGILKMAF